MGRLCGQEPWELEKKTLFSAAEAEPEGVRLAMDKMSVPPKFVC